MVSTEPVWARPELVRTAVLSPDSLFRYRLSREWDATRGRALFVMLNPSTGDALTDDRTIRRCVTFADRWGFGGLDVVNLYAFRETDPWAMKRAIDPVGPENDSQLREAIATAPLIVCAWGTHAAAARVAEFKKLAEGRELLCLGTTRDSSPRHPLYVHGDTRLVPWGSEE